MAGLGGPSDGASGQGSLDGSHVGEAELAGVPVEHDAHMSVGIAQQGRRIDVEFGLLDVGFGRLANGVFARCGCSGHALTMTQGCDTRVW